MIHYVKSNRRPLHLLLKDNAEFKGYNVLIKRPWNHIGNFALLLERNGRRKACEICPFLLREGRVYSITKYFDEGYDTVVLISKDTKIIEQLRRLLIPTTPLELQSKVFFLTPEEFTFHLNVECAEDAAYTTTYNGYTVYVHFEPIADEEAESKRKQILNALLRADKERNTKS